jgi:hypothetical protein
MKPWSHGSMVLTWVAEVTVSDINAAAYPCVMRDLLSGDCAGFCVFPGMTTQTLPTVLQTSAGVVYHARIHSNRYDTKNTRAGRRLIEAVRCIAADQELQTRQFQA